MYSNHFLRYKKFRVQLRNLRWKSGRRTEEEEDLYTGTCLNDSYRLNTTKYKNNLKSILILYIHNTLELRYILVKLYDPGVLLYNIINSI